MLLVGNIQSSGVTLFCFFAPHFSLPYSNVLVTDKGGRPYVEVAVEKDSRKAFSPEEVSAMILTKMKETAEVRWACEVTSLIAAWLVRTCN